MSKCKDSEDCFFDYCEGIPGDPFSDEQDIWEEIYNLKSKIKREIKKEDNNEKIVNVLDFEEFNDVGDDWSGAIQAAIDYVSEENGYPKGATIYFPPNIYRIDKTIVLGRDKAHNSTRLSGHGAVLLGTNVLDSQPHNYEERRQALIDKYGENNLRLAPLDEEFDEDGNHIGIAILELINLTDETTYGRNTESSNYVVEGFTLERETPGNGVGIKIPAEYLPRNTIFRDIQAFRQNYGFHFNFCWTLKVENCYAYRNNTGLYAGPHTSASHISDSLFRRNDRSGIVIGGSRHSSVLGINNCLFEDNMGYGIKSTSGARLRIVNCYFEKNENAILVDSELTKNTRINDCVFQSRIAREVTDPNEVNGVVVSGNAHVVLNTQSVYMLNNTHAISDGLDTVMIFSLKGGNELDYAPVSADGKYSDGDIAKADGLGVYRYNSSLDKFEEKQFLIQGG